MAFDAAQVYGAFLLVMEYVEGVDLQRLVEAEGPLPVEAACDYVRQAALGLQHAHERGLVHGDVKPSNLLVSPTGLVKLLDLGLARLAGRLLPTEQMLAGTPDYMAPEVAQVGRPADIRADLYSLGCTLYWLLTGRVPFPADSWPAKLLRHQLDDPVPVEALRPDVPPAIAAVVARLLARDPGDRPSTPAALAADLGRTEIALLEHRRATEWRTKAVDPPADSYAGPAPPPAHHRLPLWCMAVMLASATGILAAVLLRQATGPPGVNEPGAAEAPPPVGAPFAVEGVPARFATLAQAVAWAGDGGTVTLHGNGPFRSGPVRLRGKALTLRAAPGWRPCIRQPPPEADAYWQPLLTTDRPLTLEGICLQRLAQPGAGPVGVAHLVYCENAALRMRDCDLRAAHGSALVVCRGSDRVELHDCRLTAGTLALCVEPAEGRPCEVVLARTTLRIERPGGTALSLWGQRGRPPGPVRLVLEGNAVQAGQVVALAALPAGVEVTARHNEFVYHDALLELVDLPADGWQHSTTWQGDANRCHGPADWLRVDGVPVVVPGRQAAGHGMELVP
jgi:hypothetical protein